MMATGLLVLNAIAFGQTETPLVLRTHVLGPLNGNYALSYHLPVRSSDAFVIGGRYTDWRTGYVSHLLSPSTVGYSTNLGMIAGYQTAMYTSAWHLTALLESGFHATKITGAADRDSSRVQGVYVHPQLHIERAFRLGKRFALIPSVGLVWKYTSAPFARLAETEAVHNHDVGFGMSRSDLEDLHNGLGVQMRVDLGYAFD